MAGTFQIKCSGCSSVLQLPDSARGKIARCPKCKNTFRTPAASSGPELDEAEDPPPAPARRKRKSLADERDSASSSRSAPRARRDQSRSSKSRASKQGERPKRRSASREEKRPTGRSKKRPPEKPKPKDRARSRRRQKRRDDNDDYLGAYDVVNDPYAGTQDSPSLPMPAPRRRKRSKGTTSPGFPSEPDRRDGSYICFSYTISIVVLTFQRHSAAHFIPRGEGTFAKSLPYTLITLVFGWWGFPWGPIFSIGSLITNLSGGVDVSREVHG